MGFRPAPKAAGRRERSDRRVGGSVGALRPAPRATLSKTYKTYTYLLGTVFGTSKMPFLVLANANFGTSRRTFRARPEFGTSPDIGHGCGQLLRGRHKSCGPKYPCLELGFWLVRGLLQAQLPALGHDARPGALPRLVGRSLWLPFSEHPEAP